MSSLPCQVKSALAALLDAEARQLRPTLRYYRKQIGCFLRFMVDGGFSDREDMTFPAIRA